MRATLDLDASRAVQRPSYESVTDVGRPDDGFSGASLPKNQFTCAEDACVEEGARVTFLYMCYSTLLCTCATPPFRATVVNVGRFLGCRFAGLSVLQVPSGF